MWTDENRFWQIKIDSDRWEYVLTDKNKCTQIKISTIKKIGSKISRK